MPKGEGVPNDYYVRNPDESTWRLKIRPDTRIRGAVPVTHLRPNGPPKGCGNCSRYPVSIEEFLAAFAPNGRGPQGKYWVHSQLHAVVAIEEQYTP